MKEDFNLLNSNFFKSDSNVLVIGDVVLDRFIETTKTYSNHEKVDLYKTLGEKLFPGNAANVYMNTLKLGLKPQLIGTVGDDSAFEFLQRRIKSDYLLKRSNQETSTKSRIQVDNKTILRIDKGMNVTLSGEEKEKLINFFFSAMNNHSYSFIIISDLGEGVIFNELMSTLRRISRSKGIKLIVDPSRNKSLEDYKGSYILLPNLEEFNNLTNSSFSSGKEAVTLAQNIIKQEKYDIKNIIIKDGEKGSYLINELLEVTHVPALASSVVCSIGAGDSFISMLAKSLISGMGLKESYVFGNLAASIVVNVPYTSTLTINDVLTGYESLNINIKKLLNGSEQR